MIEQKKISIKEDDQKYIITIHKSELKSSNLLSIWAWLKKIISIQSNPKKYSRTWNYLGSTNIDKDIDTLNLRDFAHE